MCVSLPCALVRGVCVRTIVCEPMPTMKCMPLTTCVCMLLLVATTVNHHMAATCGGGHKGLVSMDMETSNQ